MRPPHPKHIQTLEAPSFQRHQAPSCTHPASRRRISRLRPALLALGCAIGVASLFAGSASAAWTTNLVQLDNGTCGRNLQIGSDKTASASNTPSFWLMGDGGLSSYAVVHRRRLDRDVQLGRQRQRLHHDDGRRSPTARTR